MLRFGLSRAHSGNGLVDGLRRFSELVGERLGVEVRPVVVSDYERLLEAMLEGALELSWMPPILHARAAQRGATLAAVNERGGVLAYRSALLVRASYSAHTLADLGKSTRAAWTDANSAAGYLFARLCLQARGIDPDRDFASQTFCGSPAAACGAVADGSADLCASFVSDASARDFARAMTDVSTVYPAAAWRLRVLAITDPIPPDGIVLAPSVKPPEQARIRDALLQIHRAQDGPRALKQLMNSDRLVAVNDAVRKALAALRQRLAPGKPS